jgi:phosphate transport system permease protein
MWPCASFKNTGSNMTDTAYQKRLAKRYASERRFKASGAIALTLTSAFLIYLLVDVGRKAWPAFFEHRVSLTVALDPAKIDKADPAGADFSGLVKEAWRAQFPEMTSRSDKKKLGSLLSQAAADEIKDAVVANPTLIGSTLKTDVLMSDDADLYFKGLSQEPDTNVLDAVKAKADVSQHFAWRLFSNGDSREPELAGLRGSIIGSLFTVAIALALGLPLGVAAAIYLEQFASKNRWTDLIEVNINNLAAVPSIIFGLLGLAMFLNVFGMPRSAPLVGGLVLALLVLPTIIIASRAALRAVPPSIKEAALGVGASHQQAIFHHVLPLALPGILTGAILGLARALGETAPLLMIGMVAFIADVPKTFTDAATVLPVQIYLWSDLPELAFQSKTAAAILVLVGILFCLNGIAIFLRKKFERRW